MEGNGQIMTVVNKNIDKKNVKDLEKDLDLSLIFHEDDSRIKEIFNDDYQNRFIKCFIETTGYADDVLDIIVPEFFESYQRVLVEKLIKYCHTDSTVFEYETVKRQIVKTESDSLVRTHLKDLVDKIEGMDIKDKKDVQETARAYFKKQGLRNALKQAAHMWKKNDYESIANVISDALKASEPKDTGHNYFKDIEKRLRVNYRNPVPFLPFLDSEVSGGLSGGELGVVMAPPGGGKSMALVRFAVEAIRSGKKVVYYTLELSENNVGQRFDACLCDKPLRQIYEWSDKIKEILKKYSDKGGELYIKEYPTGYATINTIKAHLTSLKRVHNFVPDVIMIDYADIMRPLVHYGEKRHTLTALYESIRGLAVEMCLPIWTATQTNRMAIDKEEMDLSHIGEALGKAATADVIIGVTRTKQNKADKRARFHVIKNRNGQDGFFKDAEFDTTRVFIKIIGGEQFSVEKIAGQSSTFRRLEGGSFNEDLLRPLEDGDFVTNQTEDREGTPFDPNEENDKVPF